MVVVCLPSLSFTSVAVVVIGVTALRLGSGGGLSAFSLLHLLGDVGCGGAGDQLAPLLDDGGGGLLPLRGGGALTTHPSP